jgi:hypothetical protein
MDLTPQLAVVVVAAAAAAAAAVAAVVHVVAVAAAAVVGSVVGETMLSVALFPSVSSWCQTLPGEYQEYCLEERANYPVWAAHLPGGRRRPGTAAQATVL